MAFSQVNEFIDVVKKQLGINDEALAIIKIWDNELGSLAQKAKLVGVKDGVLLVEAAASAYVHEITLRRREIIKKINQHFGVNAKVVKKIKVFLK